MRNLKYSLFLLMLILAAVVVFLGTAIFRLPLEKKKINIEGKELLVWVAQTHEQRLQGLQNIIWVPKGSGMLFVFERPDDYCFWNKNTLLPLDLIFMLHGEIVAKIPLRPIWQGKQTVCPPGPVDSVIEIPTL
jgi:uncharacterized membrane protein (UPF0127 family)